MTEITTETPLSLNYDAATRDDAAFNRQFNHGFKTIDDLQMHYVIGGDGLKTIILLHGFPQSWYEWRAVMPHLLEGHRVIAIDLPGLGDSTGSLPSYDKKTLATYVHRLLVSLGVVSGVKLVAHDFGSSIAYALAANYREQIASLFIMDFPVTGGALTFEQLKPLSFHFGFFTEKPLAEMLVEGREREFLSYFFESLAVDASLVLDGLDEYTRVYSRPGVWHNGMEWYRAWPADEQDNADSMKRPLTLPVRILTQEFTYEPLLAGLKDAAPDATGRPVKGAGHWLPEERTEEVLSEIRSFFGYADRLATAAA
ncbi:alpha/beta hydrolase [uncultured Jannaschia sp.]|uniref:alpha/beta fold hydrolase n=1 Tax=uncultured Jannaschia sp. TaxID=293347 RepID=UPI0026075486|nr:alpha/beta hydrolase [uncultured Jannaschia sp.]